MGIRKLPQGVVMRGGRLIIRENGIARIFWNSNMIADLKRYYPNQSNKEVADILGVSERTMIRKARELGLSKSEEYINNNAKVKSLMGVLAQRKKKAI